MKRPLLFITLILSSVLFAENPFISKQNEGIKFFEGTWKEAITKAKSENKHLFLDISASWCGPCKALKAYTFPNSEVGAFFSKNYICKEVDGEIGEGIELAKQFRIEGYPTLIFLDKNEKVIMQTAGFRPANVFIELGKQALGK